MVEGRPATAGGGVAAGAAEMQRHREIIGGAGFQDRPVAAAAERFEASWRNVDLGEAAIAGAFLDFGDRGFGVFDIDLDCTEQAGVGVAPVGELPFVDGGSHGGAELDVALAAGAADQRGEKAVGDVEQVKQLFLHHRQVGTGVAAGCWPGVHAHADAGRHAGIHRGFRQALAGAAANGPFVLQPAFGEERIEVVGTFDVGMHVAVDEAHVGWGGAVVLGGLGGRAIQDSYIHHDVSFRLESFRRG